MSNVTDLFSRTRVPAAGQNGHANVDARSSAVFDSHNEHSDLFFPVEERPYMWQSGPNTYVSHKAKMIVRTDTETELAAVGLSYKIVTNRELLQAVELQLAGAMTDRQLNGVRVHDAMAYGGAMCLREYRFPAISYDLGDSTVNFRTIVSNGYGGHSLKLIVGAIDMFCLNGMIVGDYEARYRRHTKGLVVSRFTDFVRGAVEIFYTRRDTFQKWYKTEITDEQALEFFEACGVFSERLQKVLFRQFLIESEVRGRTVWALYSAMTYHASFDKLVPIRSTGNDHRASTMLKREEQVLRATETKAFKALAA